MTTRSLPARSVLLGIAALSVAGLLSACSFGGGGTQASDAPRPGRSASDATRAVAELPGITSAEIATSTDGTPNQVLLLARVSAETGYPASPSELFDYVIRQAWSATEKKPTTTLRVELSIEGQDLDLENLAKDVGLTAYVNPDNKYDTSVHIQIADVTSVYGKWPGPVPSAPASLTGSGE